MSHPFEKAEKARSASQFKTAEKIYSRFLRKKSLAPSEKAGAYLGLADVERIQGYFPRALRHYEQASRLLKNHPEEGYWDAQAGWALAARACGRPREALAVLQKVLAAYRREGDPEGEAFGHWALGGTWRIAGNMKRGLTELRTALRMFQNLKETEGIAYTCCALGGIYRMLGRYADSGKYYREANRRMRRRNDAFGIAYSYCGLGNVQRMAGRFDQALPFYRNAEGLYGAIGDRVSYAYTLWSLGTTYKMLGQYTQAHRAFRKADRLFRKTGDTRGRIYSLLGFAETEFLKATNPRFLPAARDPSSSRLRRTGRAGLSAVAQRAKAEVRGKAWWKKARAVAAQSSFAWEKLHVEALRGGITRPLVSRYRQAGSLFHPVSMPVNWP